MSNDTMSLVEGALAHKEPEKKVEHHAKKVQHMHIKRGHSGGYIVTHKHHFPEIHPDEEHVVPDTDALHDHVEANMGEPNPGEAEADAGQPEAIPQPGASGAMAM